MKDTKKQPEYKIAFIQADGRIIEPKVQRISDRRYTKKTLAEAYCDGVNDLRGHCTNKRGKGNYLVVNADLEVVRV